MLDLHHWFARLEVCRNEIRRLVRLRLGIMLGNQLFAQLSNISVAGFMNIYMSLFVPRKECGRRVVSDPLQGLIDHIETFGELMDVIELNVPPHIVEAEPMQRR